MLVGRRESLAVFGNDYPTEDGTGVRDTFTLWDFPADGHVVAMENRGVDKSGVHIYNLGAVSAVASSMWSTPFSKAPR